MLLFFLVDDRKIIRGIVRLENVQSGAYDKNLLIPYLLDEDEMWRQPQRMRDEAIGMHLYEYTDRNAEILRKLRT